MKRQRIKWSKTGNECGHGWNSHRCVKEAGHENDETDDEHQCCCGITDWVTA